MWVFSPLSRRVTATVLVIVIAVSASMAAAQDRGALNALPDARTIATDGRAVEQLLGDVGLDAAWRAATGLSPISRAMVVEYTAANGNTASLLIGAAVELKATAVEHDDLVRTLREVAVELNDAREAERDRQIDRNQADVYFRGTHALTQSVAVGLFSGADPAGEALLGLDGEALTEAQRTHELTSHTLEEMMERLAVAEIELRAAISAFEDATALRVQLDEQHRDIAEEATGLAAHRRALEVAARSILPTAAEEFVLAAIPDQPGLTPRALDAYINAEKLMALLRPGCRLSWQTVAAVGSVEGRHGSYGGRRIDISGVPDRPIIGIALDGALTDNFGEVVAAISDTDNGRLDHDPVNDRAVGPMQFIPQTWQTWALDGDADGETDPQDIDDAAVTAAAYLCNYGSLRSWTNWNSAVFGYNHSVAYVTSVKASLDRVARIELPEVAELDELELPRPSGAWVAPPAPVVPPEELTAAAE